MTTLDDLWYGNLEFTSSFVEGNREYFTAANAVVELEDKLRQELPSAAQKIVDELGEKQLTLCAVGEKAAFICGVRFGVRFLLDVLSESA